MISNFPILQNWKLQHWKLQRRFPRSLPRGAAVTLSVILIAGLLGGCGQPWWLPPAHKIEIQQGNLISETQKNEVQIGQTRENVLEKIGQPVLGNVFKDDRWDYVYSRGPAGAAIETRKLTILFENDRVSKVVDNYDQVTGELNR